jgi:molecular chaperone GrpE
MSAKKKTSSKANKGNNNAAPQSDESVEEVHLSEEKRGEEIETEADKRGTAGPEIVEAETMEETSLSAEQITKLIQEKEEYYDRLLRTQADFDNYRKRVQKEQSNLLRYGAENALLEILPVVDNFERALDSTRVHGDSNSNLREGVEMILGQFLEVFKKLGATPIETVGEIFDPNKHDALLRVHAPDVTEGTVVEEIRKGYYLHDKVLRPAQVTVSTRELMEDS